MNFYSINTHQIFGTLNINKIPFYDSFVIELSLEKVPSAEVAKKWLAERYENGYISNLVESFAHTLELAFDSYERFRYALDTDENRVEDDKTVQVTRICELWSQTGVYHWGLCLRSARYDKEKIDKHTVYGNAYDVKVIAELIPITRVSDDSRKRFKEDLNRKTQDINDFLIYEFIDSTCYDELWGTTGLDSYETLLKQIAKSLLNGEKYYLIPIKYFGFEGIEALYND